MSADNWTPSPLVVDGWRECVPLVAALPSDWTAAGERLVLFALACDAYKRDSAPGLDNLAAWTGMPRSSVARIIKSLLERTKPPRVIRPALITKANASKGRATSRYRLELSPQETSPPRDSYSLSTVSQPSATRDTPLLSPERNPLSAEQLAVAKALNLKDDDEKLPSVPKMLKDNNVKNPLAWIASMAKSGELERLLDEAHAPVKRAQANSEALTTEVDLAWAQIVSNVGEPKAIEVRTKVERDLASSYFPDIPAKKLIDAINSEIKEAAS